MFRCESNSPNPSHIILHPTSVTTAEWFPNSKHTMSRCLHGIVDYLDKRLEVKVCGGVVVAVVHGVLQVIAVHRQLQLQAPDIQTVSKSLFDWRWPAERMSTRYIWNNLLKWLKQPDLKVRLAYFLPTQNIQHRWYFALVTFTPDNISPWWQYKELFTMKRNL